MRQKCKKLTFTSSCMPGHLVTTVWWHLLCTTHVQTGNFKNKVVSGWDLFKIVGLVNFGIPTPKKILITAICDAILRFGKQTICELASSG